MPFRIALRFRLAATLSAHVARARRSSSRSPVFATKSLIALLYGGDRQPPGDSLLCCDPHRDRIDGRGAGPAIND
jgi:hypothetical protein